MVSCFRCMRDVHPKAKGFAILSLLRLFWGRELYTLRRDENREKKIPRNLWDGSP
jgi:hypothetical protein